MREIQIGKKYKHFKNKMYEVIDIVLDSSKPYIDAGEYNVVIEYEEE